MGTLERIVLVLAIVLLAISAYAIVTIGIPSLSEIETVAARTTNQNRSATATPVPATRQPPAAVPTQQPTSEVQHATPEVNGDAAIVEGAGQVAREFAAPGPAISPADFDAMVAGVDNTLGAKSFGGSYRLNVGISTALGTDMTRVSLLEAVGDFVLVADVTRGIGFQVDAEGSGVQLQTMQHVPFNLEMRVLEDQVYLLLPFTGATTWLTFNLDETLANLSGLPIGTIPLIPGANDTAQGLTENITPELLENALAMFGNLPFNDYTATRIVGETAVEGVTARQYRIEVDLDGLLNDPAFEELLSMAAGGQSVAIDPATISDLQLNIDVYVGIEDQFMRRVMLSIIVEVPGTTLPDGSNQPESELDLTLDLTMRGFNGNFRLEVPPNALPLDLAAMGTEQS